MTKKTADQCEREAMALLTPAILERAAEVERVIETDPAWREMVQSILSGDALTAEDYIVTVNVRD